MPKWNFLYFSLGPLLLALSLDIPKKSLAPSFLHSPLRHFKTLLFSRLNNFSSLSLSWCERWTKPIVILMAFHWTCFSKTVSPLEWGRQNWTSTLKVSQQCWAEDKDHLFWPAGNALSNVAQEADSRLCHKGILLAHGQLSVHQGLQELLCQASFQPVSHQCILCITRACKQMWETTHNPFFFEQC